MKMLKKFTAALLAAAAAFCGTPAAVFAAGEAPRIVLNASGMEGQYILRLEQLGSRFESVQFDILVKGGVAAPQVEWQDDSPAHFQQITDRQENGKTVLTVYIDRLRPIANSGSVNLASLTFSQDIPAAAFSAGNELLALDEHQEETLFSSPAFAVTGATSGGGGGSSSAEGDGSSGGRSDSSGSSGSGHFSGEQTVLRWEDVSAEKTGETDGKKALFIRVLEGQVISADIFRQAQQQGLWLRLDYDGYIWLFDTSKQLDIPAGRVFYDLSVRPLHFRNLSAAVEGSDLLQFEIAYSGKLPCPATLFCPVGSEHAGGTVHLSYYNENETTLEFRESVQVGENGMAAFAFTHASRYVVSEKNFWEAAALPAAGTAAPVTAASPVVVAPEDEVKDAESAEPEPEEPGPEETSSEPEQLEEDDEGEGEEAPASRDRRRDDNLVPLLILFLSAVAVTILLLQMRASKKRRYRR